jgi:hypothetical protein
MLKFLDDKNKEVELAAYLNLGILKINLRYLLV